MLRISAWMLSCSLILFSSFGYADTYRVATEGAYFPFNFIDESGELAGFDVEMAHALCQEMQAECEVQALPWDRLIPALTKGEIDWVIASMGMTPERDKLVDFTNHYYRSHSTFVGPAGLYTDSTPDALAGLRLATGLGTMQAEFLQHLYPQSILILTDNMEQSLDLLRTGQVDLVLSDTTYMLSFLQSPQGEEFDFVGGPLKHEMLSTDSRIAVGEGNEALRRALNQAIERTRINGQYDLINQRYFPFDIY